MATKNGTKPADRPIAQVFALMAEGESLRKACAACGVPYNTFLGWVDADPALADQYTRARAAMLDAQAEMLEDIADQAISATTAVEVAALRLKSDNRKWLLSKLAPKKYGDKLAIGGDDGMPAIKQDVSLSPSDAYMRLIGK